MAALRRSTIASPSSDLTIPAGTSVSFGTATAAPQRSTPGSLAAPRDVHLGPQTSPSAAGRTASLTVILTRAGTPIPSPPTRIDHRDAPRRRTSPSVEKPRDGCSPSPQPTTFTVSVLRHLGFAGSVSLSVASESRSSWDHQRRLLHHWRLGSSTLTMNTTSARCRSLSLTVLRDERNAGPQPRPLMVPSPPAQPHRTRRIRGCLWKLTASVALTGIR